MPRPKKQKLKQRKDGRYKAVYHGVSFMGRTSDEALALRDEYIRREKEGLNRVMTVKEYAEKWLPIAYPSVAASTYRGLAIHLEKLVEMLGDEVLSTITPLQIREVYSTKYLGLSNSYIKSGKQLFCSFFDSAVANGYCRTNPARDKDAKPHKGNAVRKSELTAQQRHWIETLCTDHRAHAAVMAMLYAGLRPPEAKALLIERDVDFESETITLHEFAHLDGQRYDYTSTGKTDRSSRTIPLFPPLKKALEGKSGYLITSAHGERVTIQTWKTVWSSYKTCMETAINECHKRWYGRTKEHKKMLADEQPLPAWIEFNIKPYDLRHAFCVMCRDNGVEINTCIEWMGHADATMILKVYDDVSTNRSIREAERLKKTLFGVQDEVQDKNGSSGTLAG